MWREGNTGQSGKWTDPFKLVSIDRETCKVQLPSGVTDFRTTVIKPFLESEPESEGEKEDKKEDEKEDQNTDNLNKPQRNPDRTHRLPVRFRQNTADVSVFFLHDAETFENTPPLFMES